MKVTEGHSRGILSYGGSGNNGNSAGSVGSGGSQIQATNFDVLDSAEHGKFTLIG